MVGATNVAILPYQHDYNNILSIRSKALLGVGGP